MSRAQQCRQLQQVWMLAFDDSEIAPEWVQTHLNHCEECRSFATAAERARREISRLPVTAADLAVDRELLALLQRPVQRPPLGRGSVRGLGELLEAVFRSGSQRITARPTLTLVAAGAGSFAATLAVAVILAATPAPSYRQLAARALESDTETHRRTEELQARRDAWLNSPMPALLPLPGPPLPDAEIRGRGDAEKRPPRPHSQRAPAQRSQRPRPARDAWS